MAALTQDDFVQGYTDLDNYPRMVNWTTDSPLTSGDLQITATVLQRQVYPGSPWEFIPSLKASSATLSRSADAYGTDPYTEDADVLLAPEDSFDDAIRAVMAEATAIARKYR